jgi:hypothetical protein
MDTQMHAAALPDADPQTLARPENVAAHIAALIRSTTLENGARVVTDAQGARS